MPAKRAAAATSCQHDGCNLAAGPLGYCGKHVALHIEKAFTNAVTRGYARVDVPRCFSSTCDFHEYIVLFVASMVGTGATARHCVDYCRDCNPAYQTDMLAQGRCMHTETVFLLEEKTGGDLVGVSAENPRRWESAIIGAHGAVVRVPPDHVVAEMFSKIGKR